MQGVGRNPGLDGCSAPAVDDNALWHLGIFLHPFAEEVAYGRKEPRVLLVQGLPVDTGRKDVCLHTVDSRFVLHTEQAHLIVLVGVNLPGVLRIDALNGHVDVRLSGKEPHITD